MLKSQKRVNDSRVQDVFAGAGMGAEGDKSYVSYSPSRKKKYSEISRYWRDQFSLETKDIDL